jgi:hypothetical protein
VARTPRNYPYNATTGALKDSAYSAIYDLAEVIGPVSLYDREEFFNRARAMYPEIGDDDLWDIWREWYQT